MNLREQFEKWYRTQNKVFQDTFNKAEKGERDRYYYDRVESGWQGFQSGHAAGLEQQAKRIAELEASLADSNEALQVMGLKLAHAEGHSANTVGGPTPVMDAAPACEPTRISSETIAAGHPCFDPDGPPDHDWEYVDDSFSHEFGTEICGHYECARCNAIKPE